MPSKKRLLRKMVQPWFEKQEHEEKRSEKMVAVDLDAFNKEFEQEFIDWLLIALRESDSIGLLTEILEGKSIDRGTLRRLFRVAEEEDCKMSDAIGESEANEQESGNQVISWRNENQVIGSQGEQDGGHQSLHLEQIIIGGNGNNENLKEGVQDNNENGCGSSHELSPVGESLKWFVQDGKGTIRRRPPGGTTSGKCEVEKKWPTRPYNLEQLLCQFKRHQESEEEESICQSDESGIESLTQDDDDDDDDNDDSDDEDDNELDKTLVPQDYDP